LDREELKKRLESYRDKREEAIARFHTMNGAAQAIEELLAVEEKREDGNSSLNTP
jgi:hypothetical protein